MTSNPAFDRKPLNLITHERDHILPKSTQQHSVCQQQPTDTPADMLAPPSSVPAPVSTNKHSTTTTLTSLTIRNLAPTQGPPPQCSRAWTERGMPDLQEGRMCRSMPLPAAMSLSSSAATSAATVAEKLRDVLRCRFWQGGMLAITTEVNRGLGMADGSEGTDRVYFKTYVA